MVLDLSPENFSKEFAALPSRPRRQAYRAPDGEHFHIARVLRGGTVVTDSGRWIEPEEWKDVEPLT